MRFEQILADCIEALDQGETIDGCLARYPQHAARLRPMLMLVAELRGQPKPRLSATAFAQIRSTLATNAQKAGGVHDSAAAATPLPVPTLNGRYDQAARTTPRQAGHRRGRVPQAQRQQRSPHPHYTLATDQPSTTNRQGRPRLLRTLSMGLALCLLVSLVVFARQMALSLPGTSLYSVKRASEQVQGIFMTAAGDGAQWHAKQATLRMGELAQLPAAAHAQQESLAQAAATHVESALAAGAALPEAEQVAFLLAWQADLQQLDATLPASARAAETARARVQAALTAVALALTPAPTVLPTSSEPTPLATTPLPLTTQATTVALSATVTLTPALPVATATLLLSPTLVLTATATPSPTLTVTPTPVLIPSATASMTELPTVVPTATPFPVITQVMELEESSSNGQDTNQQEQDDATHEGESSGSTQDTSADGQSGATETATSIPASTADALTPVPTAESLTPTADDALFFTPTSATPAPATTTAQTPVPFLTQQPTLIAPEASTKVATPVEQYPTVQSTGLAEPVTAVPTDVQTSEPTNERKATVTSEPTRTPKPTATTASNDATPTRRRTPEPTAPPPTAAAPTASAEP